jgi:hypothetical protein
MTDQPLKQKATKGLKKAQAALTQDDDGSGLDAVLAKLKTEQAKSKAEQKKREEIAALPPEVFLRARELRKKGKFERQIAKRSPKNLDCDTVELECGHKTAIFEHSTGTTHECSDCLEAWLRRQGKKAAAGQKKKDKKR